MYIYLMLATLSVPKIDMQIGGKDCYIKAIVYDGWSSQVYMMGNCDEFYQRCLEDNCDIIIKPSKEYNFGSRNDIG